MTTYPETIDFLYSKLPMFSRKGPSALKKDLTNIRRLCEALGNPQNRFKSIHVGGTNGKGSVCHMLSAILQQSGYKTGLHTSPHLLDFRERIRVNGAMASKDFVIRFVEENRDLILQVQPSFFEISVAMAFSWFAVNKVDVAVVEVGLGGRLDSTNILTPLVSVITNISLEHTAILGNTKREIAGEKAGIVKRNVPVVIGETNPETAPVFTEKARLEQAPIYFADQLMRAVLKEGGAERQVITVIQEENHGTENYILDLPGNYQAANLRTALCTVEVLRKMGWRFDAQNIKTALQRVKKLTRLRGRWEALHRRPLVIADVGHNVAGIREIMAQVRKTSFENLFIVTGFVKDKNVREALAYFPPEAQYFFCQAANPRALPATELKDMAWESGFRGMAYESVREACRAAMDKASSRDMVLICGSTFVVAEALEEY